ncbi:hypothetical protein E2P81_ATG05912 [Venturia nashicola]|uniref:DUF7730 domain-containing protein n=1 Tax=Venturia nashicola TaxID=86259 RepID=A0A4Z1NZ70_9PEZI|nr:hypothetical protein E6O75_ATG06059 [Venturia nashicola]TLD29618.1 hypothetical protein E2P81_ATG05912 [Venturia nashicola]
MIDFLELPGELRNKIYRYCFVLMDERSVKVRKSEKFSGTTINPLDATSQLLAVCRQVYTEAMPILYSENKFHFNKFDDLPCFRRVIGEKSAVCVTNIIISQYWQSVDFQELNITLFEPFLGLKKLCFKTYYHKLPPRISELQPGTIVSANSIFVELDSPHIDPVTAHWLIEKGLEVMIEVMFRVLRSGDQRAACFHYYRLIPTPKTSELNSSQIGANYDLEFISVPIL